jgi:hypothetical protein
MNFNAGGFMLSQVYDFEDVEIVDSLAIEQVKRLIDSWTHSPTQNV